MRSKAIIAVTILLIEEWNPFIYSNIAECVKEEKRISRISQRCLILMMIPKLIMGKQKWNI